MPELENIEHADPLAGDDFIEPAIELVAHWLRRAAKLETSEDRKTSSQLRALIMDDSGVDFVMQFVDRVARPEHNAVAATQLSSLMGQASLPQFLSPTDRILLRIGGRIAPLFPFIVMPLAARRMRSIVGHLVAPAESTKLKEHLSRQRAAGYAVNVNLLGEAVLGEAEAATRLDQLIALLQQPDIDYVSVKVSAVASQISHWDYEASLVRVIERTETLLDAASSVCPPTFINFDMEEYHDLHLTVDAFKAALSHPSRVGTDAGIVLQAYLPDILPILRDLTEWANDRHASGGGTVKIRLVKGANLAMERVDAALHGWPQAPYETKIETDANYRRCLDWLLTPNRLAGVRLGLASHNLFDVAWTKLLAENRGVSSRVQFEMLQGMASAQAKAVGETTADEAHSNMLLYTPSVARDDFDVAISYLFRRLEENASDENFMRALFDLAPGSEQFELQADQFRRGTAMRNEVSVGPRRTQDRGQAETGSVTEAGFHNEPDTDPALLTNRQWILETSRLKPRPCREPLLADAAVVAGAIDSARVAATPWARTDPADRRRTLHRVAEILSERRGELIATMMSEASKTIAEADVEITEAIDFARWYGDRATDLNSVSGATFTPLGIVSVIPPWNFPVAIPAGGVLAALAAGNSVLFKPAPQTPRCAEIVAEACWDAGVPRSVLQFMRVPDNELGRQIVEAADAVILTGSTETADLFRSWNPKMRLMAETSGKNALIITPSADLDLAAHDLVRSAFGHAGQKCSAASLAVLVGDVYHSDRFKRQLVDAARSLTIGSPHDLSTDIAPLVDGGNERLIHAATALEPGQDWLLKPSIERNTMTPGILQGVSVGSWFHRTECFGPVLGLMRAATLDDAIHIANGSDFALTGGIHSLDPAEVEQWTEQIEVGNGYVNRPITGAIVQRQPFGGWKRSSVGLGAKAGGVNYLMQLGTWQPASANDDYQEQWDNHFSIEHDETALACEANIFRYRPLKAIGVRVGQRASDDDIDLIQLAARVAGVAVHLSSESEEPSLEFIRRMSEWSIERIRGVGHLSDNVYAEAARAGIHLIDTPVTPAGRLELQHYLREQAMSVTLHRFGNLVSSVLQR